MQITTEERTNAAARQNFTGELRQRRSDVRPPEPLSLSEWANKYAVLSKETSAQRADSGLSRTRWHDGCHY